MNNIQSFSRPLAFILLVLLVVLSGCRDQPEPATQTGQSQPEPPAAYDGLIVAMGDSLTAGQGVPEELSYPAQLQEKLMADGYRYRVVNAGISGETSSGALARLDWILTMEPDIVILETGANDGLRGIDPAVPRQNIETILVRLADEGVVTILAGMQMVWNLGPEYTTAFNALYPELAASHDVLFMEFFLDGVAMRPELNNADGIHPNGAGYTVITEALYPLVLQAIARHETNGQGQ